MATYKIPPENVLRHFDVTGKRCPAPFVENPEQWKAFKERLNKMTVEEAKATIKAKAGLSDRTIEFMYDYRFGDELLIKLATAMKA